MFKPECEYGQVYEMPVRQAKADARKVLPPGTYFEIRMNPEGTAIAWYYSPDLLRREPNEIPQQDVGVGLIVLARCIA